MLTDIRYGIRQLIKHPGFTIVAILAYGVKPGAWMGRPSASPRVVHRD